MNISKNLLHFHWKVLNGNSEGYVPQMNLRSLIQNFDELQQLIDQNQSKPSFLCLSETWFSSDQPFEQFKYNDYKPIVSGISNKCHAVDTYIHQNVSVEIIEQTYSTISNLIFESFHERTKQFSDLYKEVSSNFPTKIFFCNLMNFVSICKESTVDV